jgi:hypothetical protein
MKPPEVATLVDGLAARGVEPTRVGRPESETRTPHRRRRAAALREPALPGMSARSLRGRDPLTGLAGQLAVVVEGASASLVGLRREVARDLALDAGLRTMFCPTLREQVIRAADIDRLVDYLLARGITVVVRPHGGTPAEAVSS